jgi:hypothetical protein
LRSRPFNEWCTNECGGLTDLHVITVLQPVECPEYGGVVSSVQ